MIQIDLFSEHLTINTMKLTSLLLGGMVGLALCLTACNKNEELKESSGEQASASDAVTISLKVEGMT